MLLSGRSEVRIPPWVPSKAASICTADACGFLHQGLKTAPLLVLAGGYYSTTIFLLCAVYKKFTLNRIENISLLCSAGNALPNTFLPRKIIPGFRSGYSYSSIGCSKTRNRKRRASVARRHIFYAGSSSVFPGDRKMILCKTLGDSHVHQSAANINLHIVSQAEQYGTLIAIPVRIVYDTSGKIRL